MRYAISTPNFGDWADPRTMVSLARDAETSGWDGFFLIESLDPWWYGWDNTAAGSSVDRARERILMGPPRPT